MVKDASRFLDSESYRRYLLLRAMGFVGIAVHAGLIPLFLWLKIRPMAAFNLASLGVWVWAFVLNEHSHPFRAIIVMTLEVAAHTTAACWWVGWGAGYQFFLMGAIPISVFVHPLNRGALAFVTGSLFGLFCLLYLVTAGRQGADMPGWVLSSLFVSNAFITFLAMGVVSYLFRSAALGAEKQVREAGSTDALTGLPNRRRIREAAESLARGLESGYCVCLGDIDHFKRFNDLYGQSCGDAVLRSVAETLRQALNGHGSVGRWGGEEFLIVTEGTMTLAAKRLEEARQAVERHHTEFLGRSLTVTMTFGVAQAERGEDYGAVIKRADGALNRGKEEGRNRVVAAA
jgi:diguanylate cyclase (GGDEF)-like protein